MVDVTESCEYLSTVYPSQYDQQCIVQLLWDLTDVDSAHEPVDNRAAGFEVRMMRQQTLLHSMHLRIKFIQPASVTQV